MKAIDNLNKITEYAKKYSKEAQESIQRNNHMNDVDEGELVQQRHIDAVLVDFINYMGIKYGIDYGIYTKDLKEDIVETKENDFPEFWYESNACWGYVKNMEDLKEKCYLQTDPKYGALTNKDHFLDRSRQNADGSADFGTRMEHKGMKTLREFLVENEVDIDLL